MIGPDDSHGPGLRQRIDTLPSLARAAAAVDVAEIPRRLLLLAVTCADAAGIGAEPVVAEAFAQWRADGAVAAATRSGLVQLAERCDRAVLDDPATADRDAAFRRARAVHCALYAASASIAVPADSLRAALREACYEASAVLNGPVGVVGVLERPH